MVLSNYARGCDSVLIRHANTFANLVMFQMDIFSIIVVVTNLHKSALIGMQCMVILPLNSGGAWGLRRGIESY
jgi:hypothetical protein